MNYVCIDENTMFIIILVRWESKGMYKSQLKNKFNNCHKIILVWII